MGYTVSTNFNDADLYSYNNKPQRRPGLRKKKPKRTPLKITFERSPSPELLPEEKLIIDSLCGNGNVFFKPRDRITTKFECFEKWHLLFDDVEHYIGWLYFSHLDSEIYSGYDVDVLKYTSSGDLS